MPEQKSEECVHTYNVLLLTSPHEGKSLPVVPVILTHRECSSHNKNARNMGQPCEAVKVVIDLSCCPAWKRCTQ